MAPSSSSSSSSSSSAGYALAATAMALSGTLVLFSLRRANKPNPDCYSAEAPRLRPCLSSSSSEKRKREKARRGSMKKQVRFADDSVVDNGTAAAAPASAGAAPVELIRTSSAAMPANREALYRGMLRGRSVLRVACSY